MNDVVALEVGALLEFGRCVVWALGAAVVVHLSLVVLEELVDVLLLLMVGLLTVVLAGKGTVVGILAEATVVFVLFVPSVVLARLVGAKGDLKKAVKKDSAQHSSNERKN